MPVAGRLSGQSCHERREVVDAGCGEAELPVALCGEGERVLVGVGAFGGVVAAF